MQNQTPEQMHKQQLWCYQQETLNTARKVSGKLGKLRGLSLQKALQTTGQAQTTQAHSVLGDSVPALPYVQVERPSAEYLKMKNVTLDLL